jgi:rRNA maturation endonuclease Nob1
MKEQIQYKHKCGRCKKMWWSFKKIDECPKCDHPHIWFNRTSELVQVETEVKK